MSGHRKIEIGEVTSADHLEIAHALFREYQQALGVDLSFQDFETELRTLPGDYVRPRGLLVLALDGGDAAGCIALRPFADDLCEMKRLYVRPAYRKDGLGQQLAQHVISHARAGGYRRMVLDTLPTMGGAQRLYERMGFREIAPYRYNPIEGTRFLGLEL
jgi:putative acetyltransferase